VPVTRLDASDGSDYRYCWVRGAAFVVRALNRLGATRSMEEYLRYIFNLAAADGALAPTTSSKASKRRCR